MVTYIRRLYYPHVMRDPVIISEGNMTVSVWSFEDPLWAGTSGCEECQGAMVLADSLSQFIDGLETSQKAFRTLRNAGKEPTTFHFVLTGNEKKSLELFPAAEAYLQDCKFYTALLEQHTVHAFEKIDDGCFSVWRRLSSKWRLRISSLLVTADLRAASACFGIVSDTAVGMWLQFLLYHLTVVFHRSRIELVQLCKGLLGCCGGLDSAM